jgi:ParE toxin of type II toxin-antitoxin system, parDE
MSFSIEFDPKADIEYFKAWDWYEEQLIGLGDRFGDSVIRQIELISKTPLVYPSKKPQSRECEIEDFPFLIVYKIYPVKNLIYIVSIFHTSRNPRKKYRK